VVAVLADFGFAGMGIAEKDLLEPGTIIQLGLPPNRIDLVTSISGVEFADAWPHRLACQVEGLTLIFIDKQSLRINKAASGRPKDLADLDALS
jgi:hypothetical protein